MYLPTQKVLLCGLQDEVSRGRRNALGDKLPNQRVVGYNGKTLVSKVARKRRKKRRDWERET